MESDDARKLALDHAWKWFEYHANQRLVTFRFYLILVASLLAADFVALREKMWSISIVVGAILVCVTYLFFKLDERNKILVKLGEAALTSEENYISGILGNDNLNLVEKADIKPSGVLSYRQIFSGIFLAFALLGIVIVVYSVTR
ncbi:MAG: hypothetical protein IIA72_17440 [Proteobacteria bacterium]|nr:hypothetical protein [Pseudomonadota bacterium]